MNTIPSQNERSTSRRSAAADRPHGIARLSISVRLWLGYLACAVLILVVVLLAGDRIIAVAISAAALPAGALLVWWVNRSIYRSVNGNATLAEFPRRNPNGVLAVSSDGEVIYRNPSVQQFMDERSLELEQMLPATHRDVVSRLMDDQDQEQRIETSGEGYVLEWFYYPVKEKELVHLYVTDITERRRAEEQLIHDSFHDSLTGLSNRALFVDRLEQTLSVLDPDSRLTFAVFFIDLDRFKVINESLGPDYGDALLRIVADRLRSVTRPQDTVARVRGDEFAVLLPNLEDSLEALHVANRIHEEIRKTVSIRGEQFTITCSIGIVFPGNDRRDAESARRDSPMVRRDPPAILRDADSAMYSAKSSGKAKSEIFNSAMYERALSAMRLETELIQAVKNGEITAYYQPIVSLKTGRIAGFEALARWLHPDRGLILPDTFIPLAEETGLIIPIGGLILREAAEHVCAWRREHPSFEQLFASVNLSVRQFGHPSLMDDVRRTLDAVDMKAQCLKLEITESGLMENVETSLELLTQLKKLGITLAIDDFGTGYSSLSYLHRFPFDTLKIDRSFVGNMEQESESRGIVTNVLSLAHGLVKETIAEGVETDGQLRALRKLNAEFGQGYFFSRALPAADAADLLSADPHW